MSIAFRCSGCGKSFSVKDELAGRRIKCRCGKVMAVPMAAPAARPEGAGHELDALRQSDPFGSLLDDALPTAQKLPAASVPAKAKASPAAPPPAKRKPKVKVDRQVLTNMVLGTVLIIGAIVGAFFLLRMGVTAVQPGYATPEEAFAAYQKALYDENWRKMMRTLDTESQTLLAGRAASTAWMAVHSETTSNLRLVLSEHQIPEPEKPDIESEFPSEPLPYDPSAPQPNAAGAATDEGPEDSDADAADSQGQGSQGNKPEGKGVEGKDARVKGASSGDSSRDEPKGKGETGDAGSAGETAAGGSQQAGGVHQDADEEGMKLVAGVPDKVEFYANVMEGIEAYKKRHASGYAVIRVINQKADLSVLETCSRGELSSLSIQGDTATATATYTFGEQNTDASVMFKMINGRWFLHVPRPGEATGLSFADLFRIEMLLPR